MNKDFSRCHVCGLLEQHLKVLFMELEYTEVGSANKIATLMEMKCYYWLTKAYSDILLKDCDCDYSERLNNIQENLKNIFVKENIILDENRKKCDICRVLPCEIFSILDRACVLSDLNTMDLVVEEMQYHVILAFLYEKFIGKCTECDEFIEYVACLKFLCEFIDTGNQPKLQQDVYLWKIARNNDEILSCASTLNNDEIILSTDVDLKNHTTVYLDFNVYQKYENDDRVQQFFKSLIQQEKVDIIYSGTHLEEIFRMRQDEYEAKRVDSIQELTGGKIAVVGNDKKIVICIQDIKKRFQQVKKYSKMNEAAEERECIHAEAREHLGLHKFSEKQDKAIGRSSLRDILSNVNQNGEKKNEYLPDEEALDKILRYVGIGTRNTREYMDALKHLDMEFEEIRNTIVSIAELLNILGLHGDKIKKKTDPNAVYPIYGKESFRTIKSGYYDNDHLAFATQCTYFVTMDDTLYKKAKEIYDFLGVETVPILLKDFMKLSTIKR